MSELSDRRMIPAGKIEVMGDVSGAMLIEAPGTAMQAAVDGRVIPAVGAALADPTTSTVVSDAADIAVDAKVGALDVLTGADPRAPKRGSTKSFEIQNADRGLLLRVGGEIGDAVQAGRTLMKPSRRFGITGRNRRRLFEVNPATGETFIAKLRVGQYLTGAAVIRRVYADIGLGQSNMEGRGRVANAEIYPPLSRHLMWRWSDSKLAPATVPLSSRQQMVGLSSLTPIARQTLLEDPEAVVLSMNAGIGGSGLVSTPTQGTWAVDYTNSTTPARALWSTTQPAIVAFLAAAQAAYPGAQVIVRFWWDQGGADGDSGIAQPVYAAALDALIAACRSTVGVADAPFVLGGMAPNEFAARPGRLVIRRAHVDTPARVTRTAYSDGPWNANGSGGADDPLHLTAEGQERQAHGMLAALKAALVNTATAIPYQPGTVTAVRRGDTLTVEWTQPRCRVTDYVVEWSVNGGTTWTAMTGRPDPLDRVATTAVTGTSPVTVRVTTVNALGSSIPTAPTPAIQGA